MKKETILITGASGNVGKELVDILSTKEHHVIAAYHHNRPKLVKEGVEYRHFDITDSSTFEHATKGVDKIFLVRPPQISKVKKEVLPFLLYIKSIGIKQVVFLSVQGAESNSIIPHAKIETYLQKLQVPHTSLRPCYFMQNLTTTHLDSLKKGSLHLPSGDGKTSFIDVRAIAAIAAIALVDNSYISKNITITNSTSMSFKEVTEILNKTCNVKIKYTHAHLLSFLITQKKKKLPFMFIFVMWAIYHNIKQHKADIITKDASVILQRELISFEQFCTKHCHLFTGEN